MNELLAELIRKKINVFADIVAGEVLVDAGADVSAESNVGSALYAASTQGHAHVVGCYDLDASAFVTRMTNILQC